MESIESVRPEITARSMRPNRVMREDVLPFLRNSSCRGILDFGAGCFCRDSIFLGSHGFNVWVKELPEAIERMNIQQLKACGIKGIFSELNPCNQYDAVLLNYVLNVIPYQPERELVLHQINHCLKPDGYAVVTVRSESEVENYCSNATNAANYNDGYILGKGARISFQKGFKTEELTEILRSHGMGPVNKYRGKCITVIARKIKDDILYGQTLANPGDISEMADYIQVSLNNRNPESIEELLEKIPERPVMFHGDYGNSVRDNAVFDDSRIGEIIRIIEITKKDRGVYGLTLHSPTKSYMRRNNKRITDIADRIIQIQRETNVNVTIEHRSSGKFGISTVDEIMELGDIPITVDIAALFVSLGYNNSELKSALEQLNRFNTIELHLSDSLPGHQRTGAVIGKGVIDYYSIKLPPARYRTVEVLSAGGFEESVRKLESS